MRIGEEAESPPPSSHTIVRTVPYTAVHEVHWKRSRCSSSDKGVALVFTLALRSRCYCELSFAHSGIGV